MVGWQWINHLKGSGRGIIWDSIPNLLEDTEEDHERDSVKTAGLLVWTLDWLVRSRGNKHRPSRSNMPRMRYATVAYFNKITLNLTGDIQKHDNKSASNVITLHLFGVIWCLDHKGFFGLSFSTVFHTLIS